jgi:hypothetical protein
MFLVQMKIKFQVMMITMMMVLNILMIQTVVMMIIITVVMVIIIQLLQVLHHLIVVVQQLKTHINSQLKTLIIITVVTVMSGEILVGVMVNIGGFNYASRLFSQSTKFLTTSSTSTTFTKTLGK